jgi:hypothetical protein
MHNINKQTVINFVLQLIRQPRSNFYMRGGGGGGGGVAVKSLREYIFQLDLVWLEFFDVVYDMLRNVAVLGPKQIFI